MQPSQHLLENNKYSETKTSALKQYNCGYIDFFYIGVNFTIHCCREEVISNINTGKKNIGAKFSRIIQYGACDMTFLHAD